MGKNKKIIKFIGIDWGEKRIGLAVADNQAWLATPAAVVYDFNELLDFIARERPDRLVVGLPYTMAGHRGKAAQRVAKFIKLLKEYAKLPVTTIDERLTSSAVDSLYHAKNKPAERDAIAAMLILQNYIDGLDKGTKKAEKEFPKL